MEDKKHVVIIGNGIAGITVARHIRKQASYRITVISNETKYFFSRTALMYIYMGHLKYEHTKPYEDWFWEKNRIELLMQTVRNIDTNNKKLEFSSGGALNYDVLLIACGSKPNKFGWPGQDLKGVQGLYHYQDLQAMEEHTKGIDRAVIVGGGLIGIEMAEMLHTRKIPVTFLVRENSFWNNVLPPEESEMINREIREHHIDLRLDTELKEILSDENGRARAVLTNKGEEIPCQFVGLTAGVRPNIEFMKDSTIETDKGVLVNHYLETNIPDVYAAGDCAEFKEPLSGRKPLEQVWYTGKMMGETLANTICGIRTKYNPGVWFNSAKFFNIEYQTYGLVSSELKDDEKTLYWEHPDGKKSIRINYGTENGSIIGVNVFGIRHRHEVWDAWISNNTHIEEVLQNLGIANFDPEFFEQYEKYVVEMYNRQTGKNIKLRKKRGLKAVLEYFKG